MRTNSIIIATGQTQLTPDTLANGRQICDLMSEAAGSGARLVHFTEGALSGYAKAQIKDWNTVDWLAVRQELERIAAHARSLGIWVAIGCNHRLTPPNRPHNSVYVISDKGKLVGRYDKRFLSHTEVSHWYAPGKLPVVFDVDGFKFGCALCIEVQFPELFSEYERLGVDCILLSTYSDDPMFGIQARAHAAVNCFWLSLATPAQCSGELPSALMGPDGSIISQAAATGAPSLLTARLDRSDPRYEVALTNARPWRAMARSGSIYHGLLIPDRRSTNRLAF
jgi:predicted amidohydrolase